MVDVALIAAAKRSPVYRLIRPRVADPCPSDGWYEWGCAFVVFDLTPSSEGANDGRRWVAHVVFAVARATGDVLAARVVEVEVGATGDDIGAAPVVHDLLRAS